MAVSVTPTLNLEYDLALRGADIIIGFDEVGRGALAGPAMVGAAAIWADDLPDLPIPAGVADSKMLTARRRENMVDDLKTWCAAWAVGSVSAQEIDEWGITPSLGIAALRAIADIERQLTQQVFAQHEEERARRVADAAPVQPVTPPMPDVPPATQLALFDDIPDQPAVSPVTLSGAPLRIRGILDGPYNYINRAIGAMGAPDISNPVDIVTRTKGDQSCATVATAAVIAKVTRDRLMVRIAQEHPDRYGMYGWDHNKGYGSKAHKEAIRQFGPSDQHRTTWHLQ